MRLDDRALSRALALRARTLASALAGTEWDADRVQRLAVALFAARLLAHAQGVPSFQRATARQALMGAPRAFEIVGAALETGASDSLSQGVDDMIRMLAEASTNGVLVADALLRFYESFLEVYAPSLRRKYGVYYTPPELAAYVVAEVDRMLREECGAPWGLASEHREHDEPAVVLDPAAGTGAFLCAVVRRIHASACARWREQGLDDRELREAWQRYVPTHVLPRVAGFDVMPLACALADVQLRLTLAETGYELRGDEHVHVYAVDALQLLPAFDQDRVQSPELSLLARSSVMVGNPPYARGGGKSNAFWQKLLAPYKAPLRGEKNLQPLADDYVRFLRFGEWLLSSHAVAVLGFVTSSTFLGGHLHRGMRESLARTFPRIDVLDLGGSTKHRARADAASRDENIFEIAQGVAASVMARAPALAPRRRYALLRGRRAAKLEALREPSRVVWTPLVERPDHRLSPQTPIPEEYAAFPSLLDFFELCSVGAKPGDDEHLVSFDPDALMAGLEAFRASLREDPRRARTEAARRVLAFTGRFDRARVTRYAYRPFDVRFVYEDPALWIRPVRRLRARLGGGPLLLTTRFAQDSAFAHAFCTRLLPDVIFLSNKSSVNCFAFPRADLRAFPGVDGDVLFSYLYAVLHSSSYRARYAAGLAADFPRVPLARDPALREALAAEGAQLVATHLGERETRPDDAPRFIGSLGHVLSGIARLRELPSDTTGRAQIPLGGDARFSGIDAETWQQRIGGYQVCHKWLLDRERRGRALDAGEIASYGKLVAALCETRRRVQAIDALLDAAGGLPRVFAAGS